MPEGCGRGAPSPALASPRCSRPLSPPPSKRYDDKNTTVHGQDGLYQPRVASHHWLLITGPCTDPPSRSARSAPQAARPPPPLPPSPSPYASRYRTRPRHICSARRGTGRTLDRVGRGAQEGGEPMHKTTYLNASWSIHKTTCLNGSWSMHKIKISQWVVVYSQRPNISMGWVVMAAARHALLR